MKTKLLGFKMKKYDKNNLSPFNTYLEAGVRALCFLSVNNELSFDLDHILALDHLIVHTGDLDGGPDSLHLEMQNRNGELLIRRPIIENGLFLMESKGLSKRLLSTNGVEFVATDFATVYLDSLKSEYILKLRRRAQWAIDLYINTEEEFFSKIFNASFGRWTNEFQFETVSLG